MPRVLLALGVFAVVATVISISVGDGGPGESQDVGGVNEVQRLLGGISQEDAYLGPTDAEVTITVFNDLQCGPCADFQLDTVDPLIERYARTDEARFEFRHFPVTEHETTLAAIGAEAAGEQARQWQFIDTFVRNIDLAGARGVDQALLDEIAAAIPELEIEQWERDFDDPASEERVVDDGFLAAELELPGEPAIVVSGPNGQRELIETPSRTRSKRRSKPSPEPPPRRPPLPSERRSFARPCG